MSDVLELNCVVRGEDAERVFTVEIKNGKTVSALKRIIKEEKPHGFQNVDANDIEIWKVNDAIPADDDDLSGKIDISRCRPLRGTQKLSDLFRTPLADGVLHILVQVSDYHVAAPPSLISLNCWVFWDDADRVFPVEITREKTVGALKKAIKDEKQQRLQGIDADVLDLWKVSISPENRQDVLQGCEEPGCIDGARKLNPTDPLSRVFEDDPALEHVHVVVQAPEPVASIGEAVTEGLRNLRLVNDVTTEILARWRPDVISLPKVADLRPFLDKPFDERSKIPLERHRFEAFISTPMQISDRIQRQDLEMLFRINEHEHAEALYLRLSASIMNSPPNNDATESSFHSFWDSNIRQIMEILVPGGISIRDSNRHTSTAAQRPDFGFLYLNVCPFRGEEKSPVNPEDPRAELSDKMTWTYDPAPYVLGYYATGTMVTLTALCRPLPGSQKPQIVDILKVDLRPMANRIRNLVRLINLCSLIVPITTVIGSRTTSEFVPITRDGKTIEVCGTNIKKTYDGPQRHVRIENLRKIYEILQAKNVPNVDRIVVSYSDDYHGAVAFLEPKGISVMPNTILEVLEAVSCILGALMVIHAEPEPIFHRDIRWPNVVKRADDPTKWVLIDWEDATAPPTLAAKHLDKQCHAPAVFEDNHGPEVDIWAVGMLILQSSRCFPSFPRDLLAVGESMQSGKLNVPQSIETILAMRTRTAVHTESTKTPLQ